MRYSYLLLAPAFLLMACNQSSKTEEIKTQPDTLPVDHTETAAVQVKDTVTADKLIIPGKSIGQTALNDNGADVIKRLGRPDAGDAAMGKSMSIWYADHDSTGYQTMIYTTRQMGTEDDVSRVKQIRITSPWFATKDNVHVGSTLQDIDGFYKTDRFATFNNKNKELYTIFKDDIGIAFEIDQQGECKAIVVFDPKFAPGQMYLPFYDNLKIYEKPKL